MNVWTVLLIVWNFLLSVAVIRLAIHHGDLEDHFLQSRLECERRNRELHRRERDPADWWKRPRNEPED